MMIRNFEEFEKFIALNEGDMQDDEEFAISTDSSYWQKAVDFFKEETGKDLRQFRSVFVKNSPSEGILPQRLAVELFKESPVTSKYTTFITELETVIDDDDLSYYSGMGAPSTDVVGSRSGGSYSSLNNSKALYKIWVDYFYIPVKNAIQSKNFSSISMEGMSDFEDRMRIYTLDLDSDWKALFRAFRVSLEAESKNVNVAQTEETPAPTQTQTQQRTQPTATSTSKSSTKAARKWKMPKFK